jgi:hypothetical protein
MPGETQQFRTAIEKFDAANAQDPTLIGDAPAELVYARRMTDWLHRLYPDASEALQLAARAQHIRRWMIPRSQYPMTRAGYHQWRTTLYSFHADEAAKILREVGYDDATINRVRSGDTGAGRRSLPGLSRKLFRGIRPQARRAKGDRYSPADVEENV